LSIRPAVSREAFLRPCGKWTSLFPEQAVLNSMVGPKLSDSLLHLANVPSELVDETIGRYRRHYKETGIGQSKLYPGIFDLLEFFAEPAGPSRWQRRSHRRLHGSSWSTTDC
jgi:hypothetical protein